MRLGLFCRVVFMSLLSALVAACSGQALINTLTPSWGYTLHEDIAYANGARQKLDVYVPDELAPGAPAVVFFYGGSWQFGDKDSYKFVAQALTSRGIIAVLPDYRLHPEVTFPAFVKDGAQAVAWTRAHIQAYGGNACNLFVAGHSAGAQIAALLVTNRRYLDAVGVSVDDVAGFIGMAGPYEFLPITDPDLQAIFAPRHDWPLSQPVNYVSGNEPPMLLMHGSADTTVHPEDSRILARKINPAGGEAELKIYEGVAHVRLLAPLAAPLRFLGPQLDHIDGFISRVTIFSAC